MKNKIGLLTIILFMLSLVLSGCYLRNSRNSIIKSEETTTVKSSSETTTEISTQIQNTFDKSQTAELYNYRININNIERNSKSDSLEPGYEYLYVDLTIVNLTGKEIRISLSNFYLLDNAQQKITPTITSSVKYKLSGKLGAGRKMSGECAFIVPKGSTGNLLVFTEVINKNQIIIALD